MLKWVKEFTKHVLFISIVSYRPRTTLRLNTFLSGAIYRAVASLNPLVGNIISNTLHPMLPRGVVDWQVVISNTLNPILPWGVVD